MKAGLTFEEIEKQLAEDNLRAFVEIKLKEAFRAEFQADIEAQDDLLLNGTNDASDKSLERFGLKRTIHTEDGSTGIFF